MTGTKKGFGVFHIAMKMMVKDKKRVLKQLAEELEANPPTIIIPGHGVLLDSSSIADDAQRVIAEAL